MKSVFKPLLLTGLLATLGFTVFAQGMGPGGYPHHGDMMGQGDSWQHHGARRADPAKIQAWVAKRQAALKAKLKLTPAQEGAWTTYTAAMTPPASISGGFPDRAELEKLSTPERIDKMKALRTQRDAAMDKRADATKAFYAVLTPEQKKVFDAGTLHPSRGGPKKGPAAAEQKR